jgi:polar amino acid transport system substrate-binding protein
VAIDATYPPMEFEGKDGRPAGFDVDLSRELAARLGVEVVFVVMGWDGIIAGLTSRRYDVIISAMNVTPRRQKQLDFVEYARVSQVFLARRGTTIRGEQDLAGKVVAVQADTTSYTCVRDLQRKGVRIRQVKAFRDATEVFVAVKVRQADVAIVDEPVARYYARQDPGTFAVTGRALAPEPISIALRKGEQALQAALARAVGDMKKDGTLRRLAEKWFGEELGG